jgi:GAF domain-containing protein
MDSAPETAFDELVELASHICEAPIALITLIDESRQWFKAKVGLAAPETPREQAFCAHAILADATLIVPDATEDERFSGNPLVRSDPNIRFYAGAPLRTPEGHRLGTLCVIDTAPRLDRPLAPEQVRALETLSRQVVRLLEYRRVSAQLAGALERVKALAPLVPICAWCKKVRDDNEYWSSIDVYLATHAGVETTHGICPSCAADVGAEFGGA